MSKNCSVEYVDGKVYKVTEEGKDSEMFNLINSFLKDKDQSYVVYSKIRDGVSLSALDNSTKAALISGPRVIVKNSDLVDMTRGLNLKSSFKSPSPETLKKERKFGISVSEDGDYTYVNINQGKVLSKSVVIGDRLELLGETLSGKGEAEILLKSLIKERLDNGQSLEIDTKKFKGVKEILDAYVRQGIMNTSKGTYFLQTKEQGGFPEALSDLKTSFESLPKDLLKSARNLMMSFGVTTNQELLNKLKKLEVNGVMNYMEGNLKKIFNVYEAKAIAEDLELQNEIQEIREKIASTSIELDYNPMFVVKASSNILGGAQEIKNPYIVEQEVQKAVAGQENPLEALPEEYLPLYEKSKQFRDYVTNVAKNYGATKVFTLFEGNLVESKGDILGKFNLIMDETSQRVAENALDTLDNMDAEQYSLEAKNTLKEALNRLGLEGKNVESKILTEQDQYQAEQVLEHIVRGEIMEAALLYDSVLNTKPNDVRVQYQADNSDVFVENINKSSEAQLFRQYSLVRISENTFREVERMSPEEMIENSLDSELNPNNLTPEEYKANLIKESSKMGIPLNSNEAIEVYLHKISMGAPAEIQNTIKPFKGLNETVQDSDYIREDFVKDFSMYLSENPNANLKVTGKGIEFEYSDPISVAETLEGLPQELVNDLVEYSKISKHMEELTPYQEESLEDIDSLLMHPAIETEVQEYDVVRDSRNQAFNFPESLPKMTQPFSRITTQQGEQLIVKENAVEDFLNLEGVPYERVAQGNGIGVYKEGPKNSSIFVESYTEPLYMQTNFAEVTQLTKQASEATVKDVFVKGELEKINKNFKC